MENDVDDDGSDDVGDEIESHEVVNEDEGKLDIWEDIYGGKRDAAENIINESADPAVDDTSVEAASKYIPPARRNTNTSGSQSEDKRIALSKQLKGLLNRLAEANMHGIAREVEGFYRQFSRNVVNTTITDLLMSSLVAQVHTPIRLVMEHVMLLAIFHVNVGTEVKRFSTDYSLLETPHEDKTLENIILLISYLYSFKIVGSKPFF